MTIDRLFCVQFAAKGAAEYAWSLVVDEERERIVPAAYMTVEEAERRRSEMTAAHPDYAYRVVGFSHAMFMQGFERGDYIQVRDREVR